VRVCALCFVFFFCVEKILCVGGRCSNCFFGTQKKKMQKKKKNKWLSSLGRLSEGSFFCEIFFCPCFCNPSFHPFFFCEAHTPLSVLLLLLFLGWQPFYTKTRYVLHICKKPNIIPHDPFRTVCRSLARAHSCNRDVFIKTQTFSR